MHDVIFNLEVGGLSNRFFRYEYFVNVWGLVYVCIDTEIDILLKNGSQAGVKLICVILFKF